MPIRSANKTKDTNLPNQGEVADSDGYLRPDCTYCPRRLCVNTASAAIPNKSTLHTPLTMQLSKQVLIAATILLGAVQAKPVRPSTPDVIAWECHYCRVDAAKHAYLDAADRPVPYSYQEDGSSTSFLGVSSILKHLRAEYYEWAYAQHTATIRTFDIPSLVRLRRYNWRTTRALGAGGAPYIVRFRSNICASHRRSTSLITPSPGSSSVADVDFAVTVMPSISSTSRRPFLGCRSIP